MEPESCACGSPDASWSAAFAAYLCESCRMNRTEAELGATERANRAAGLAERKAS
jgi:hypothetical protein